MSDEFLVATNIKKAFGGVQALNDVSVTIRRNQVHCLVGENGSGKSTFVKCISGVYTPDSGLIQINGRPYGALTPKTAIAEGIQVIYQDLSLFPHLTIAENIAFHKARSRKGALIDWKEIRSVAEAQLDKIGVDINLDATVGESSMATSQITAICRALAMDAKLLFMDEPTTALTKSEVEKLLAIVMDLKAEGLSIVFISHKLDEIFDVADDITIFRDGVVVGDFKSNELDKKKLSFYITGREVTFDHYERKVQDDTPLMEVKHLSLRDNYSDVSFSLRRGDIMGMTGLLGSGRTEIGLSLFGLNHFDSGEIVFGGKSYRKMTPQLAASLGIGLLPENRCVQGLFMNKSVKENISSASLDNLAHGPGVLDTRKESDLAIQKIAEMNIKTESPASLASALSGGNQQKIAIAKWTATNPKLFIMDAPTVGIDVGSKAEIYTRIQEFAARGMGILFISDEIEELINNCNRVLVMSKGRCVTILEDDVMLHTPPGELESMLMRLISDAGDDTAEVRQ